MKNLLWILYALTLKTDAGLLRVLILNRRLKAWIEGRFRVLSDRAYWQGLK